MLSNIFFRVWGIGAGIGMIAFFVEMATRKPFGPLPNPYMLYWATGFGAFWFITWCITPKKWWK